MVIHSGILNKALPKISEKLKEKQVVICADERSFNVIKDYPYLEIATEDDFYTEYGCAKISVKTVDDLDMAIDDGVTVASIFGSKELCDIQFDGLLVF